MQGKHINYTFHIPGTLAANISIVFTLPFNMTLEKVSATATNNSDATMTIGNTSTAEAYLAACTIGDSSVPVVKDKANFVGGQPVHIAAGVVMAIAIDFDGSSGTAAQNVTVVLTFSEG